jgi:hypothetical protein
MKGVLTTFAVQVVIPVSVAVLLHLATGRSDEWITLVAVFASAVSVSLLRRLFGYKRPPRTHASKDPDTYRWGHRER